MRTIFAEYNPQRNSIDVYTSAGYMLRIDCQEAEKNLITTPGSEIVHCIYQTKIHLPVVKTPQILYLILPVPGIIFHAISPSWNSGFILLLPGRLYPLPVQSDLSFPSYLPMHHTHGSFPCIQVLLRKLSGLFLKSFFSFFKLIHPDYFSAYIASDVV